MSMKVLLIFLFLAYFFNTNFPIFPNFSILSFLFSYFCEQPCYWTPCVWGKDTLRKGTGRHSATTKTLVAKCKGIQQSLILDFTPWIPDSRYWAWFLKGWLALIQDYNFVPLFVFSCLHMAWWNILCHHYCIYLRVKAQQYFVSLISCLFLDKKTRLKMWLNLGLSLTIFRGTGLWILDSLTVELGIRLLYIMLLLPY